MHIFLVNDDGIASPGIMALLCAAHRRGHRVTMCAPARQQSAASQRITLTEPIFVADYPLAQENARAFSIAGTPTDCVRLGLLHLIEEPVDVLISGINDGYNSGMAVHYSGTVGAAREGALHHLPAVAASIAYRATQEMLAAFAEYVVTAAQTLTALPTPPCTVLNINAPLREPARLRPPVFAPLSTANYRDSYLRRESPRAGVYYWLESGARTEPFKAGSDQDMLEKGHVTLTFMGNPQDAAVECQEALLTCQAVGETL